MLLNITVVVGSLRRDSYNRRLAEALVRHPAATEHSYHFTDIAGLPLYNQDQDADQPEPAKQLKRDIRSADAVIFVTPEYNRSIPGVLKNAIDHASRPHGDSAWKGKPAGIIGTSPGAMGTAMAQQHLRNVLVSLDMPTLPQPEAFVRWQDDMIGADGQLAGRIADLAEKWLQAYLDFAKRHRTERI